MSDARIGTEWDETIAAFRSVGKAGVRQNLVIASGGNFSARDLVTGNILVTASGTFLDDVTREGLSLLNERGEHIAGAAPSSEWRLHHETYRARPDATVILHLHPEVSVTVDALGQPIRQLTLDHVAYVPKIGRIPFYPNGSTELAVEAAKAMRDCDCIILGNHGCSVLSTSVADAFRKAQNLEQAARMTMSLLALGDTTTEFPQELRATAVHR
ncbi:class II aldolase/adducin family protein [Lysinibacter cavernae]|uniref:L-fuculose-phosphate aldolase n=1 Tax=Lysinibacter cavernae TaxID=1640652 RepID=A0A7X5R1Z5_9MICO|nr:class II aldolase/adducin family protein [Lysinibacter cavernae]NIH53915.1 L-fuculose-phosphate aldolase [Lysinibacter cavernae]